MDSRRISAALGFTLLIGCVIGIVILIHSGGNTRRSSQQPSQIENHFWDGKEGFVNDANYHSSQPTMQEVNELADELHRLLSKSKLVKTTQKLASVPLGRDINTKLRNGTDLKPFPSSSSSATSSVSKGSISAINYSIVPNNLQQKTVGGTGGGGLRTSNFSSSSSPSSAILLLNKNSKHNNGHPEKIERQTETPQKYGPSATIENLKKPYQRTEHLQYPGQQSPPVVSGLGPTLPSSSFSSAESGKERGGSLHDLYTTSWLPSMISQGIPASNMEHQLLLQHQQQQHTPHHYHHHQQRNHYKFANEDEKAQPLSPFSEDTRDRNGESGKELLKRQGNNHEMVGNSQTSTSAKVQTYPHSPGFDQKPHKSRWEDDDFIEDGLSGEEEAEDENDVVELEEEDINNNANHHRHHQHPPGDEEEEEVEEDEDDDEEDEDPEPKNFTAELETLLDLANHLYTSGANGSAFQGFLKVINETIQRGNNSKLLVELNEMYGQADITSNNSSSSRSSRTNATTSSSSSTASLFHDGGGTSGGIGDLLKKRDPYETSLTAFVFMSFGVFLLNQIHSFVQKTSLSNGNNSIVTGRAFGDLDWYSPHGPMLITTESSSLDILFQPPPQPSSLSTSEGFSEKLEYEDENLHHHPKNKFLTTLPQQANRNRDNDTNNLNAPGVLASYEKIALSSTPTNANSTTATVTTTTTMVAPTINSSNNSFHSETAKRNNDAGGEGGGGDREKGSVVVSSSSAGSEGGLDTVRMIIPLVQEENHEAPSSSTWSSSSFGEQGRASNIIIRSSSDVNGDAGGASTSTDGDASSSSRSHEDNSFSSTHVNNMFRALLNIVNAYTKDSQALECIWSLYCQDLDKTAGKHGLYGVAARINSVGLRLIMNQIPPSLTMDVILRSLVGWDGLPCRKMFPECAVGNGTLSLVGGVEGEESSLNSTKVTSSNNML